MTDPELLFAMLAIANAAPRVLFLSVVAEIHYASVQLIIIIMSTKVVPAHPPPFSPLLVSTKPGLAHPDSVTTILRFR